MLEKRSRHGQQEGLKRKVKSGRLRNVWILDGAKAGSVFRDRFQRKPETSPSVSDGEGDGFQSEHGRRDEVRECICETRRTREEFRSRAQR